MKHILQNLTQAHDQLKRNMSVLEDNTKRLDFDSKTQDAEIVQLQQNLLSSETHQQDSQKTVGMKMTELEAVNKTIDDLKSSIKSVEITKIKSETAIREGGKQLETAENKIEKLMKKLAVKNAEIENLKKRLHQAEGSQEDETNQLQDQLSAVKGIYEFSSVLNCDQYRVHRQTAH